jgi:lysophospholipase L1-like esterase
MGFGVPRRPLPLSIAALAVTSALALAPSAAATPSPLPLCTSTTWVTAWTASPTDASSLGGSLAELATTGAVLAGFDASSHPKGPFNDATAREIVSPHWAGTVIRVHLSNRFGTAPITFGDAAIADVDSGAAIVSGSSVPLTFGGQRSVTVPPGGEAISDPTKFVIAPLHHVAVSIFSSGINGIPTEHYTGRQVSYTTFDGAGDHVSDVFALAFGLPTTSRAYVDEVDVEAPARVATVAAIGDSITDGYQGKPTGLPESPAGLGDDDRWPDFLQRRIEAAGLPFTVANAGITGNKVLTGGSPTNGAPQFGPSGLSRIQQDAIGLPGVSTVIILEGINDLGDGDPTLSSSQVITGLTGMVARVHAAGERALLGTLTPTGGAGVGHGGPNEDAARAMVNAWIRSQHVADGVIDFDAAVRDPSDPAQINPPYDGGDHVHFDPLGYQVMANAVPLGLLRRAACRSSAAPAKRPRPKPHPKRHRRAKRHHPAR